MLTFCIYFIEIHRNLEFKLTLYVDIMLHCSVLSDAKKKTRYDSGQDLEDLEGGFGGKS